MTRRATLVGLAWRIGLVALWVALGWLLFGWWAGLVVLALEAVGFVALNWDPLTVRWQAWRMRRSQADPDRR